MSTLFEIAEEFNTLYEIASEDFDEQALADTLESITGELTDKASGIVNVIQELDMESKRAKELEAYYKAKKQARENAIKRIKQYLMDGMDLMGLTELDAGNFTIKIQKNGGLAPLEITGDVPENMTKVIIEPDNDKIRAYLKENECDWARLGDRGRHIKIK